MLAFTLGRTMSTNDKPASLEEWQRAVEGDWSQADLAYVRDYIDPALVRDAGVGPDGAALLASPFTKREVWNLYQRYPSHLTPPMFPKGG